MHCTFYPKSNGEKKHDIIYKTTVTEPKIKKWVISLLPGWNDCWLGICTGDDERCRGSFNEIALALERTNACRLDISLWGNEDFATKWKIAFHECYATIY